MWWCISTCCWQRCPVASADTTTAAYALSAAAAALRQKEFIDGFMDPATPADLASAAAVREWLSKTLDSSGIVLHSAYVVSAYPKVSHQAVKGPRIPGRSRNRYHYKNFRKNVKPVLELFQEVYDSIEMVVYLFKTVRPGRQHGKRLSPRGPESWGSYCAQMTPANNKAASMPGMTQKQQLSGWQDRCELILVLPCLHH
jgi:hypothetical protein